MGYFPLGAIIALVVVGVPLFLLCKAVMRPPVPEARSVRVPFAEPYFPPMRTNPETGLLEYFEKGKTVDGKFVPGHWELDDSEKFRKGWRQTS